MCGRVARGCRREQRRAAAGEAVAVEQRDRDDARHAGPHRDQQLRQLRVGASAVSRQGDSDVAVAGDPRGGRHHAADSEVPGHHQLDLSNTYVGMVLPLLCDVVGIPLLRMAFETIPYELEEAAAINGVGPLRRLVSVMLALARPALITVTILSLHGFVEVVHPLPGRHLGPGPCHAEPGHRPPVQWPVRQPVPVAAEAGAGDVVDDSGGLSCMPSSAGPSPTPRRRPAGNNAQRVRI